MFAFTMLSEDLFFMSKYMLLRKNNATCGNIELLLSCDEVLQHICNGESKAICFFAKSASTTKMSWAKRASPRID